AFRSLAILPYAFLKSLVILLRPRPQLVIGVGGYSSGPLVLLAAWMRFPTLILEQNRHPGFTNRILLPFVNKAVVSFENSLDEFKGKGVFLGNPVRKEFYHLPAKNRNSKLSLLIFGGSQGSHFLNLEVIKSLPLIQDEKAMLHIIHQTGEKDYEWVKEGYRENGFEDVTVAPFFYDMADCYQRSDLIVSRSGASTVAELIAAQKASLLVPFARATDDHQTLNARELEKIQGAVVLPEAEFTAQAFANQITSFLVDKDRITQMEHNLAQMWTENVSEKISNLCFELMEKER
ncbi:MAG: undecaprenyldiphospho-muramoylpentapeptide beta-N-acetylglucosaminyltransferase, partial [Candidatus Aminicenantes bacterium]|nr:undecaprenyldiphospho-muramoylpentapeptide beta-N-acetylglucosaminyltransferase [Candidatus Aminicenantes bacterium]